jgi:hypothetical protein
MTEAEIGIGQRGGVGGAAGTYKLSTLTTVSSWVVAAVFLVWVVAGPPFAADVSPMMQALARALLGVLVIAVVRRRPAAMAVAWGLSLVVAIHGLYRWAARGPLPYGVWELAVATAYAVVLPVSIWLRPRVEPAPRPAAPRPRITRETPVPYSPTIAFGRSLAHEVADILEHGHPVVSPAPGDGGAGLAFFEGRFLFDDVRDGQLVCLRNQPVAFERARAVFTDRTAFVSWLAAQSEDSLSGDRPRLGRITRGRLERALAAARRGSP